MAIQTFRRRQRETPKSLTAYGVFRLRQLCGECIHGAPIEAPGNLPLSAEEAAAWKVLTDDHRHRRLPTNGSLNAVSELDRPEEQTQNERKK